MIDRATLLGMVAALALIVWVACAGGTEALAGLWQTSSAALVIGGAVFTTLVATPGGKFGALFGVLRKAVVVGRREPEELIATLTRLAHTARREGLLAMEKPVELLEDEFLKRALRMAVDGADARVIEQVCRAELESTDLRHASGGGLVESMGRAAPVFGMMGTLIGLATMLGRMDDPSRIGPGMATALLTTLYGLMFAHVFCMPLARKLTQRSSEELLYKTMGLAGVLAIQGGDHPRLVEQKLRAYLPASKKAPEKQEPAAEPAPPTLRETDHRRERWLHSLAPLASLARRVGIRPEDRPPTGAAPAAKDKGSAQGKPATKRTLAGTA